MLNMHILDRALVCVYLTATHSCLCFKSIGIKFHHKLQSIQSTNIILSGPGQAVWPWLKGGWCRQGAGSCLPAGLPAPPLTQVSLHAAPLLTSTPWVGFSF